MSEIDEIAGAFFDGVEESKTVRDALADSLEEFLSGVYGEGWRDMITNHEVCDSTGRIGRAFRALHSAGRITVRPEEDL